MKRKDRFEAHLERLALGARRGETVQVNMPEKSVNKKTADLSEKGRVSAVFSIDLRVEIQADIRPPTYAPDYAVRTPDPRTDPDSAPELFT